MSGKDPDGLSGRTSAEAAADLVALLSDEGVSHLFINPGTDTAPVQEALAAARSAKTAHPETVLCLHEHVALSAAIGHHMASAQPQAVMVHVDAGTLNLGGAIHNAQRNRTPVVVFAGRAPYSVASEVRGHRNSPIHWQQEQLDQPAVMRAFGKWAMEVPRGRELASIVRRAFQVAKAEPTGPTYVMLPREALMELGAGSLPRRLRPPVPPAPDPTSLGEMAASLAGAQRPVIVTARTGARPENVAVLARIAEIIGAPVLDQRDRANLPAHHPLYAGPEDARFLPRADAVLLLDVEVPWVPALAAPPPEARVLQIDMDCAKPAMPLWSFPVELGMTADTQLALPQLEEALCRLATPERAQVWAARRRQVEAELAEVHAGWLRRSASPEPTDAPDAMLAALDRALPEDALLVEEAVTNRPAAARQVHRGPARYFQTGAPALGWAIGAAVGIKLAKPALPVVVVCGDGSFNFGVPNAALWTAQRAGAPFVTVILNNRSYYASKRPVLSLYPGGAADAAGDFPETELSPAIDYTLLARACGGDGRAVEAAGDLRDALSWALGEVDQGRCTVLDARLPRP
ncbi:MAG TPA: thiamine pyrophosphate-requiring protein [Candidatus Dormibacteraeota bacterium]|nr:thiamine pyrophosphate-requiring protein [Candidatus Dormibacteraeota bacterium]